MPLGVLTDNEFELELERLNKKPARDTVITTLITPGRTEGKKNVPESLRKVISEEAINGTPGKELAKIFDISQSSISAYKNGATSTATYDNPHPDLKQHNDEVKADIRKNARNKLFMALDAITPENIANAKLRDKSSLARDMSAIIKNMEEHKDTAQLVNQVQFVYHAPKMVDEKEFAVIDIDS